MDGGNLDLGEGGLEPRVASVVVGLRNREILNQETKPHFCGFVGRHPCDVRVCISAADILPGSQ